MKTSPRTISFVMITTNNMTAHLHLPPEVGLQSNQGNMLGHNKPLGWES